jgi:hypothetical protein
MVPSEAFHVTALFVVVPATVAVKDSVLFVIVAAEPGDMTTELTVSRAGAPAAG